MAGPGCRRHFGTFCSSLCAIQCAEGNNGDDARYFTKEDEKMLLGEEDEE